MEGADGFCAAELLRTVPWGLAHPASTPDMWWHRWYHLCHVYLPA